MMYPNNGHFTYRMPKIYSNEEEESEDSSKITENEQSSVPHNIPNNSVNKS